MTLEFVYYLLIISAMCKCIYNPQQILFKLCIFNSYYFSYLFCYIVYPAKDVKKLYLYV